MLFKEYFRLFLENDKVRSYSCLMLDCSEIQQQLKEFQNKICPCELYDEPGFGLESSAHCTLLYGIHSIKAQEVFSKIDLEPIKYKLINLSLFTNNDYDVLKFGIQSSGLHKLNKQIRDECEYSNDYPDYKPHLTIAYLLHGTGKNYINRKCNLLNKEFVSNTFIFSDPNGNKTIRVI